MPVHHTNASESLLPPTLPTVRAQNGENRNNKIWARDASKPQNLENALAVTLPNLPTPTVSDQYTANLSSTQQKPGSMHSVTLAQVFHKLELFMTPVASEGTKAPSQQSSNVKKKTGQVWLSNQAKDVSLLPDEGITNWGKFEPAIRRWETILGRPAPEPTKPDGKDNNHRLSSKFTEWMMGLPDGWITGHDLKRNDELKLAGNGVVPQQAELALRLLLELPERKENDNE